MADSREGRPFFERKWWMRKEHCELKTVGELRAFIADLPDEMPILRLTKGYYQVNVNDVSAFVGEIRIGDDRPEQSETVTAMRICA
jgi:hypothetical protein